MAPINLCDIPDSSETKIVTAIALILDIKEVVTKKGDRMAILQLEDLTGSTEAVVFPKTFDKVKHLLEQDKRLMVWGKIDRRDEQTQLIIDNMQPIESVRMVRVELTREQASDRQVLTKRAALAAVSPTAWPGRYKADPRPKPLAPAWA
jgi:DNA polymerase-3 subunit alpha